MTDRDALREALERHEAHLLALGRTMVEPRPENWESKLGERIAGAVNGITVVRQARIALAQPSEAEVDADEAWLDTPEAQETIRAVLDERHHQPHGCRICAALAHAAEPGLDDDHYPGCDRNPCRCAGVTTKEAAK